MHACFELSKQMATWAKEMTNTIRNLERTRDGEVK
jgi:hypothetical protein